MSLTYLFKVKFVLLGFLLVICFKSNAHGDLSLRIAEKTEEIAKDPNNGKLYLQRGLLHQQHEDYQNAIKDYNTSESLGIKNKELYFRKAQSHLLNETFFKAIEYIDICLNLDKKDIKTHKLKAQILMKFDRSEEALLHYSYVINNALDLRPTNILEFCDIILSAERNNYTKAIEAIDLGLDKIGKHTFSLQLRKLDYLLASDQKEAIISQFNYFILNNQRKEFWYYKKAKYLYEQEHINGTKIALQQAKSAIAMLDNNFKNTSSNKNLLANIEALELNLSKS